MLALGRRGRMAIGRQRLTGSGSWDNAPFMVQGWLILVGLVFVILDHVGSIEPQFFWLGAIVIGVCAVSLLRRCA